MKELLNTSNVNRSVLRRKVFNDAGNESSNLSKHCYFPPFKKEYFTLLHLCGLTDKQIGEFINRFYVFEVERKSKDNILRDHGTNLLLFIMHYFIVNNEYQTYLSAMNLLCIKFYSSRLRVHLPSYCDEDVFQKTLDSLPKNHIFSREKTIASALMFFAKTLARKHEKELKEFDSPEKISLFIYECRHRIAQSIRSFADIYYKISKESSEKTYTQQEETAGTSQEDYQVGQMDKKQKLASETSRDITVYKHKDQKAKEAAKQLTKVNQLTADTIIEILSDSKYYDDVRIILELFLREIKTKEEICGRLFIQLVQKLMSVKRTKKQIYFKQQVTNLTCKLVKTTRTMEDKYEHLTTQSKFYVSLFVAYYITFFLRNKVC